ncbi:MAG TPA: AEC family transporter [Candidatus Synoicihabitans sp.]|nr:AEC family transporter [Candidatus Synoicihabitans sp.]
MPSYWELLLLIVPVFALIGLGAIARRVRWLTEEADGSLLKLVVNLLYPCLIFENVLGNAALRDPSNVLLAPLVGYVTLAGGILAALYAGKLLGLEPGRGLRTFAYSVGIYNYGYIPIPLMAALFGPESLGVLLVHNVGCEAAIWTVGILVLSGGSLREGWKKLINAPLITLVLALIGNVFNLDAHLPQAVRTVIGMCGACAIPLGLLLIGGTLMEYLARPAQLFSLRIISTATLLRLVVFPAVFLLVAAVLPASPELKRVMLVEAAMPAGILSIVIAKHYGGQPLTAVQVVLGTTAVGLLVIPGWLKVGLSWLAP